MQTVAALYVDKRGPYPAMPGVDAWDVDRDARGYRGPHPVILHPPCGPWGQLAHLCTKQDPGLAPLAVTQLVRFGGVMEHPANSKVFKLLGLPMPGDSPRQIGGRTLWSMRLDQVRFGHCCRKPTILLFADVPQDAIGELPPEREPTHDAASYAHKLEARAKPGKARLKTASATIRRRTPEEFAEWLVEKVRLGFLPPDDREPSHVVTNFHASKEGKADIRARGLKVAGKAQKERTPSLLAEFLVGLARRVPT